MGQWHFWIDRGGTFTDLVAQKPDGSLCTHKILSAHDQEDAVILGIRQVMGLTPKAPLPVAAIAEIRMGTTVATNALLERQGEPTVLVITEGFGDALRIGYQQRPDLFARSIQRPNVLYSAVIEVPERISAQGEVLIPVDQPRTQALLAKHYAQGFRACAIVFMQGYRYPDHECTVAQIARELGFTQVSVSHEVAPVMKLVSRGETTVLDSYLSPVLNRYLTGLQQHLGSIPLLMMQSNGVLTPAPYFQGKDSLLSGPAGGMIAVISISQKAGFDRVLGFDMGGTSTDVCHFRGTLERLWENEIAGITIRTPMVPVHTIAAGGGSILAFSGTRLSVGPQSAGANPGPACYRRGGPLTITDANVLLGKVLPQYFPTVFGPAGDQPLDTQTVITQFQTLTLAINQALHQELSPTQVAEGFIHIAVAQMARAIKKVARGQDLSAYVLCAFGGAGGQHACLVAQALGVQRILLHPYAGVLSAYGMGLAAQGQLYTQTIEAPLTPALIPALQQILDRLSTFLKGAIQQVYPRVHLRYQGSDTALVVAFADHEAMVAQFELAHRERFGFSSPALGYIVAQVSLEGITQPPIIAPPPREPTQTTATPLSHQPLYTQGIWYQAPVYRRHDLATGQKIPGPALILEATGTIVIEPGWTGVATATGDLILSWLCTPATEPLTSDHRADPVTVELFNHRFMDLAEHMGTVLQNTASSVNIKERLDFSCALFDPQGQLVANAPHMPVHLGSMGESIQAVIQCFGDQMQPGDSYVLNDPYNGGTHLPDITVVTALILPTTRFYVAARGHHGDIGGITPGSMPPFSTTITQEGVLIPPLLLVRGGIFQEQPLLELLTSGPYPTRNPKQNLADLHAQVAATTQGIAKLQALIQEFSLGQVLAYMGHVQDQCAQEVQQLLGQLKGGTFRYIMDAGTAIQVTLTIQDQRLRIDFRGTAAQGMHNFHAPTGVVKAAVLYVLRTLVDRDVPLNAGFLRSVDLVIPTGSLLAPCYPNAVVAGNVETSQYITDALYGALGIMAAAQGTMNNLTFGNAQYQYYETICGGSGAGPGFCGTDAVQTHMTNSRLTDPEVLEWRFPVRLEEFRIRLDSGGRGQWQGGRCG